MFNTYGIAQIDSISGNFEYNAKKILEYIKKAQLNNIDLVIFPNNALSGNLLEDVIKRHPYLILECEKWLNGIAAKTQNITAIIGYYNGTIAIIENGTITKIIEEYPYVYKNICITDLEPVNSELIINFKQTTGKDVLLMQNSLAYHAKKTKTPVIYVNSVGANDNISYIGSSAVFNEEGKLIARANSFEEDFLVADFKKNCEIKPLPVSETDKTEFTLNYEPDMERTYRTLIQGIKGYFNKCGIKRAVLGLSGGLDSTICATLLAHALGKENVLGISMPSKITSNESKSDAKKLAENLGIKFFEAPIKQMVDVTSECFNILFNNIEKSWSGKYTDSYTQDNIQARLRAMYLFGVSNEFSSCIPIATSDKSESYMGYATINGDMSGGFAPIADVSKTKLFALAKWINKNIENVIPQAVINKRPGAELAIDPNTGKPLCAEDALMPYEFLDEIIWRIENKHQSFNDMLDDEFLYEKKCTLSKKQKIEWLNKFYKRMSSALYKWSIMPPSIIVDDYTINKSVYYQPITSGKIDYIGKSTDEILSKLC